LWAQIKKDVIIILKTNGHLNGFNGFEKFRDELMLPRQQYKINNIIILYILLGYRAIVFQKI